MKFDAGELRERIRIERATEAADDVGGQTRTWSTLKTVWAKVTMSGGRESIEAEALSGVNSYRIIVRNTDVTFKDRIVWRGETLAIRSAGPMNADRSLMLILADAGVGT